MDSEHSQACFEFKVTESVGADPANDDVPSLLQSRQSRGDPCSLLLTSVCVYSCTSQVTNFKQPPAHLLMREAQV
jgi:hypothetical protein